MECARQRLFFQRISLIKLYGTWDLLVDIPSLFCSAPCLPKDRSFPYAVDLTVDDITSLIIYNSAFCANQLEVF